MFEFLELEETVGKFWDRLVGSTSSLPRYPDAAVAFDEVKPFLATCFRGFGGEATAQLGPAHGKTSKHRLRLRQLIGLGEEKLAWASRDNGSIRLPPVIDFFPERSLNRDVYLWLAAYMASMPRAEVRAFDPLKADMLALDAARKGVANVLGRFPGLAGRYRTLCRAMLEQRLRGTLPAVERLVENKVVSLLSEGAGVPDPNPLSILPKVAPPGYQRMLRVPLWPAWEARTEIDGGAVDDDGASGEANAVEGEGRFQAERQSERMPTDRSPFILNRFEKILAMSEMINVDRPTDDDDDTDKDAAKDLDEVRLGRRKERPSSKFRFDLDLPPEAVDASAIDSEITYPEWNYRTGAYIQSYCRVVGATARAEMKELALSEEHEAFIRKVRKQFEILRPRNEVLRAQPDGDDLDLDAVVRMRADIAAGGPGTERLHLLSRPQGHDLAVTLLVDVSLSTDAWFNDRRVLDVEKQALSALANGLAACGTNHSILTFTSRSRSWVRIETVKAFGEPMGDEVERRIAALRPGYYTRLGAAIRHASSELANQPNRTKLILILTDGKPNDVDHYEGRFALEDSRKAVWEARRSGQSVFAVTVDKDAQSYLPSMFGRNGFAVVGDIARLPRALPAIYRGLTR